MAKVQLGKMGALHPANRLAAYLTGRVGSGKKQPSRKPPQFQSSAPAPQTTVQGNSGLTGNPPPGPDPSVKVTVPSTSTGTAPVSFSCATSNNEGIMLAKGASEPTLLYTLHYGIQ